MLINLIKRLNKTATGPVANSRISMFATILKALPIVALITIISFVTLRFTSCSETFFKQKEINRVESANKVEVINDLTKAAIENNKAVEVLNNTNALNIKSLNESTAQEKSIMSASQQKALVVKEKISQIKENYQKLPETPENIKIKKAAVSTILINSVWDTYCDTNQNEKCEAAPS